MGRVMELRSSQLYYEMTQTEALIPQGDTKDNEQNTVRQGSMQGGSSKSRAKARGNRRARLQEKKKHTPRRF